MNKIKYNIKLNVKTLKDIFNYFNMSSTNSIVKLVSNNKNLIEDVKEYTVRIKDNNIYLKNIKFEKLYYFLSRNIVLNVYYYKAKSIKEIENNNYEVCIHTRMDRVYNILFNDKYNILETRNFLKKYRSIHIEYIVLFLLLIVGLLIRLLR